jgi:hypothetical protein
MIFQARLTAEAHKLIGRLVTCFLLRHRHVSLADVGAVSLLLTCAVHESLHGTNRTNRGGLMMSVPRGNPEVAFRSRQDRF